MHAWKSKKLFNNVSPPVVPSSLLSTMYCGRVLAENINHNKDIMSNNMVHPCSTASPSYLRSPPLFFILHGAHCGVYVCVRVCVFISMCVSVCEYVCLCVSVCGLCVYARARVCERLLLRSTTHSSLTLFDTSTKDVS